MSCHIAALRRYTLVLDDEVLWLLLDEEEKLLLVRRLLPPLRLIRGRLDGITARDRGGGGAGTRDGYEYILASEQKGASVLAMAQCNTAYYRKIQEHKNQRNQPVCLWTFKEKFAKSYTQESQLSLALPVVIISLKVVVELEGRAAAQDEERRGQCWGPTERPAHKQYKSAAFVPDRPVHFASRTLGGLWPVRFGFASKVNVWRGKEKQSSDEVLVQQHQQWGAETVARHCCHITKQLVLGRSGQSINV